MTRLEEKLYLQSVFDAIDQVYQMNSSYEDRLRASVSKLVVPDWYNPDYTSTNTLRKTKSHGHVPRSKRINANNNNNNNNNNKDGGIDDDNTPDISIISSCRTWSERAAKRCNSTTSSYDTNGSVVNGRRSTNLNGTSYAPGVQRVAQSSTWYKPKVFTLQETIEPPKPLPRSLKVDQIRTQQSSNTCESKFEHVRFPLKPRTMAQVQIPADISADADIIPLEKSSELPSTIENDIPRTNSIRSVSSDAESFRSAVKNLGGTDSSSYASVNDRCLSPSTASYHTALADETSSSITGYETPTPQLNDEDDDDDRTLSSKSSLSNLTHTEEDLDIVAVSTGEQKSSAMEQSTNNNDKTLTNEIREISNEDSLREIDLNAVGDEFFLVSPRDDQPSNQIYTIDDNQTMMITNLDDIIVDDQDFVNGNQRRPIQEDILYEVEHENSFSDHSQNTSIVNPIDEQITTTKYEVNIDYLTSTDNNQKSSESTNNSILPIYILPPLYTTTKSPELASLRIDTNNNFEKFDSFINQFSDLTSPSAYTSHIRHRHYSVGSYYDHRATTVTIQPYKSHYFLGSAPVSPLNRPSINRHQSDFHNRHSSPFTRVDPLNHEDRTRVITYISPRMTSKSVERTIQSKESESTPIIPPRIISPPSTRTSSVVFPQYEIPMTRPKPAQRTIFEERSSTTTTQDNPLYARVDKEPPAVSRPKTSRGRPRTRSPPTTNIYQEIDVVSPEAEEMNKDLQFIRGAIDRIFHFNGESTSESTSFYEEVDDETKKHSTQYPAVEAVQRFYHNITNNHTHSSEHSEEIDDTLNDVDEQLSRTQMKSSQQTQTQRSTVPAIDIMDGDENGLETLDVANGDMIIVYDDIEIVEHPIHSSSCSSDSDSSCSSPSYHYSKPVNTSIHNPPPVPARTLKPSHLINQTNKTYELEKNLIRKKFDVNTVNSMLSRTELPTHRVLSARHFAGKINPDDSPMKPIPTKPTAVARSSATLPAPTTRSVIADTNALVKQIQNSLSRNSLLDTQVNSKSLSTSSKDLRSFVSSTYSPSDENVIDNNGKVHVRSSINTNQDDQTFKRQARLSKSFHNVSEYHHHSHSKPETKPLPAKSVENNLHEIPPKQQTRHIPLNLTSLVSSTSFSTLPNSDDHARLLSMKWYTGQVSENSEIGHHVHTDDLLHGYIHTHSNRETQALLASLQASNDTRIHAALDDIRSRVAQFDASKTQEDLQVFMRYLESRLRDLQNKKANLSKPQVIESVSIKSRSNSTSVEPTSSTRQVGRQKIPSRRTSQSSSNQENPAVFDDMLDTVLGLPKKGVATLPQNFPSKREKPTPLVPTQITTNGRDIGKRLFESGTYKDPRLIYDGPKRQEKEEQQPLETSV